MKLVVYYPDESFLKPAEEAWRRFVEQVQPPPVEVTDIYWGEAPQPLADAIAEAETVQDLPGDPHLILRLSVQFFRLNPSNQMVTLLRVAEVEVRLDRLMADVSMATRETTTTTEVKRTTSARKPRKARKPAAVARKTRSDTKAVPARKSKTVKTSAAGTKRKAIAEVKRMKSASKKTRSATLTVPARRSKTLTTSPAGTKRRAIA